VAWAFMSGRFRWWVFEGRTGMGMAPDIEAMPPASLRWVLLLWLKDGRAWGCCGCWWEGRVRSPAYDV